MVSNLAALSEIRKSWNGVEVLRDRIQGALLGSFAQGASFAIYAADAAHNLPFVHAYGVLNDVLEQLSKEGHFCCDSIFLGGLLHASKEELLWENFQLIKEGAHRRNDVAHRGDVLPRVDCWEYIDTIRNQLIAWGVLDVS
jgi:hypothetical protein